ncbi:hypothetical protein SteCoe_31951 [Stentor coeruleus]|uniref:G-protein coupled receptors family 2 profile 2 domain-containing protein n=1 Tax=Stentor coeruleus TaxID=5963 RepID=A0A1R2B099_9CILI|nr:hypothetical protein SteCoe_31951 [Stentor coeruleus]
MSSCFLILACFMMKMWKIASLRLVLYLTIGNAISSIVFMLPTNEYSFMCGFQEHVLNFTLFYELIWGVLLFYYAYLRVVRGQKFTKIMEIRFLAIALVPSLLCSLPLFVSDTMGDNCWKDPHTPLEVVVSSYGFLALYPIGILFCCISLLGIYLYFREKRAKGEQNNESKIAKLILVGRYTFMIYSYSLILYIYSIMSLFNWPNRVFGFLSVFSHASCGLFTLTIFISTTKVRQIFDEHFKTQNPPVDILYEDSDNFKSASSPLYSGLSD